MNPMTSRVQQNQHLPVQAPAAPIREIDVTRNSCGDPYASAREFSHKGCREEPDVDYEFR